MRRQTSAMTSGITTVLLLLLCGVSGPAAARQSAEAQQTLASPSGAAVPVPEVPTQATEVSKLLCTLSTQVVPSSAIDTIYKVLPEASGTIDLELAATSSMLHRAWCAGLASGPAWCTPGREPISSSAIPISSPSRSPTGPSPISCGASSCRWRTWGRAPSGGPALQGSTGGAGGGPPRHPGARDDARTASGSPDPRQKPIGEPRCTAVCPPGS